MNIVSTDWSDRHKSLNQFIRNPNSFPEAVETALSLHAELHRAVVSALKDPNAVDALIEDITPTECAVMPTQKDETIAWAVWHIARIEDLTMNLLVGNGAQVFDENRQKRIGTTVRDTGNAMSDDEILSFSRQISFHNLLQYRDAVGIRSREILRALRPGDMKRKITPESTTRILAEGGVTTHADSIWLLDFWGKKDVAGILLMPLTRHQTLHLNDCDLWKKAIRRKAHR